MRGRGRGEHWENREGIRGKEENFALGEGRRETRGQEGRWEPLPPHICTIPTLEYPRRCA